MRHFVSGLVLTMVGSVGLAACVPAGSADVQGSSEAALSSSNEAQSSSEQAAPAASEKKAAKKSGIQGPNEDSTLTCVLQYLAFGPNFLFVQGPSETRPFGEFDQIALVDGSFTARVAGVVYPGNTNPPTLLTAERA